MPSSHNGTGTIYYGRSDETDDGSYVATVWFAILFLPIVPLRSERIRLLSEHAIPGSFTRRRLLVLGRVPLDWPKVWKTYLVGWSILGWYISLIFLFAPLNRLCGDGSGPWIVIAWLFFPFVLLLSWQKWFRSPPKLVPVETTPGSDFSVYRKADPMDRD